MTAKTLLARLECVRQTGAGRWIARCPSHQDKSPSLSIRECDDETVLVHCFAGCGALEIVQAVGMELRDLFPERCEHYSAASRRPRFDAMQALRCLADEVQIVALALDDYLAGRSLSDADVARVRLAAERLQVAVEVTHG